MNPAQWAIHEAVERQRAETGMVRAIVLKGRQMGSSTYVQGRFMHQTIHRKGNRTFILAHVDDSTTNLFNMAKCYFENLPPLVRPNVSRSNAKELVFPGLNSSYKTETAGGRGAGRSETIQLLHLSEAAYFPNPEPVIVGVTQAVPHLPGTEIFIESTSAGPSGMFYEMAMDAKEGRSEYILVFIPWSVQPEYSMETPPGFEMDAEELDYAEEFSLSPEQMFWRRHKISELRSISSFAREYPITVEEAFRASAPGALWTMDSIAPGRVANPPPMARIVVAIDPSGSSRATADAQGIIVAGVDYNGHGYVLEDGTCKLPPEGWARKAIGLYHKWNADRIVAETNYGGEMVEHTLRSVEENIPFRAVSATRGKAIRAEPISAYYEKGMVHHVGMFPALEDEMTTWSPLTSKKSPNRVDALVWAFTDLLGFSYGMMVREMEI
jgi:hypothetical protein